MKKKNSQGIVNLIVPKLYMNNHCMLPYKIYILLCRSEIQDTYSHYYRANLT